MSDTRDPDRDLEAVLWQAMWATAEDAGNGIRDVRDDLLPGILLEMTDGRVYRLTWTQEEPDHA